MGDRCEAGVGGEVHCGLNVLSGDFGEEPRGGPDPDSEHADQDPGKGMVVDELLDYDSNLCALTACARPAMGQQK